MAQLQPGEQYGRSTKKEPVYAEVTQFPKMLYNIDRTFVTVHNKAELDLFLAENKKDKLVWAESPLAFGIETAPSVKPREDQPGTW